MKVTRRFSGHHEDFVHDVAYDYYGKRLATCSSDHKIKVWRQSNADDKKKSSGNSNKKGADDDGNWVCQAELEGHSGPVWKVAWAHPEFGQVIASCSYDRSVRIWEEQMGGGGSATSRWQLAATLVDSRESVIDVKFAPRHLGLKFATCSVDGFVRIYEAGDIMNLTHWQIQDEFEAEKRDVTSLSWNPSLFDTPQMVVGSSSGNARVFGFHEKLKRWTVIVELTGHKGAVNDVAWAPNLGRSFHLIATASSDRNVKVWRLAKSAADGYSAECVATLTQEAEIWRCEWNATATVLATSGDDGMIRTWACNFRGEWECTSAVACE